MPWPPMITGRAAFLTISRTDSNADGSGHARGTGRSLRLNGRSSSPASGGNDENMISTGSEIWTGPGYPVVAAVQARLTNSLMRSPSVIWTEYLTKGAAIATSSISLKPPAPCRFNVEEPVIKKTGLRSPPASSIAGTALAKPSGPTRHTTGLRVIRA